MRSGVRDSEERAQGGSGVRAWSGKAARRPQPAILLFSGILALSGSLAIAQRRPARDAPPAFPEDRTNYRFRAQLDTSPKIDAERAALERLAGAKQWDEWLRRCQRLLDEH